MPQRGSACDAADEITDSENDSEDANEDGRIGNSVQRSEPPPYDSLENRGRQRSTRGSLTATIAQLK